MKKIILQCLLLGTIIACKKEKVVGPQGPAGVNGTNGTVPNGTIIGKVNQYDQFGTVYTTGLNTTTVSVDGTTNTAVTDATGSFTITDLAPGIYDMSYQKPSCGLYKQQQITFPGNGTLRVNQNISDKATHAIITCELKDTVLYSRRALKVRVTHSSDSKNKVFGIFFSKVSNINPVNPASFVSYFNLYASGNTTTTIGYIYYDNSTFANFISGSTVYAKVFPDTYQGYSYYDYASDQSYHTGTGTVFPTTFTLTMP